MSKRLLGALFRHHVLAGAEHRHVLSRDLNTVVDVGANRGQFALAVRRWAPHARVISFEPLPKPASVFLKIFSDDGQVSLHRAAIGPRQGQGTIHISGRDDSSSLLPISSVQMAMFPGTGEVASAEVQVGRLEDFIAVEEFEAPAMLKLDVQGFEYEAIIGSESMLQHFDWVYCECSFLELYTGQKLAWEVIERLAYNGFGLGGIFNLAKDQGGQSVQADFLFSRMGSQGTSDPSGSL